MPPKGRIAALRCKYLRRHGLLKATLLFLLMATVSVTTVYVTYDTTPAAEAACPSYVVRSGDTLGKIAVRYHTTIAALAKLNHISNANLIYVGRSICLSGSGNVAPPANNGSGLEWTTQSQVRQALINAADRRGLPRNLVLAVAWQESNWTQHVIAWDGGVGAMQLMPYTTAWLNAQMHTNYNPYRLYDNIELGTSYLLMLWRQFGGYLPRLISAYNEGSRNVLTRGIFNWNYVNNVLAGMRRFS